MAVEEFSHKSFTARYVEVTLNPHGTEKKPAIVGNSLLYLFKYIGIAFLDVVVNAWLRETEGIFGIFVHFFVTLCK